MYPQQVKGVQPDKAERLASWPTLPDCDIDGSRAVLCCNSCRSLPCMSDASSLANAGTLRTRWPRTVATVASVHTVTTPCTPPCAPPCTPQVPCTPPVYMRCTWRCTGRCTGRCTLGGAGPPNAANSWAADTCPKGAQMQRREQEAAHFEMPN